MRTEMAPRVPMAGAPVTQLLAKRPGAVLATDLHFGSSHAFKYISQSVHRSCIDTRGATNLLLFGRTSELREVDAV
jgi:hypothetical protein